MISGFSHALFAVLDGLGRAMADAGHAVGTVFAPHGLAVYQLDIIQRAQLRALAAVNAGISYCEGICLHTKPIEKTVDQTAHETVVSVVTEERERLAGGNHFGDTAKDRIRFGNNLLGGLGIRGIEHGNIVFRHDHLGGAHIFEAPCLTQLLIIFCGVADLAAAGHDKPDSGHAAEFRAAEPLLYDAGNTPGIGRGYKNQRAVDIHVMRIVFLEFLYQIDQGIAGMVSDMSGDIAAVAGTGKV